MRSLHLNFKQGDSSMSPIPHPGLLFLALHVYNEGFDNIPITTKSCLILNVGLYLIPLAPVGTACLNLTVVYRLKEWSRLLLSPVHHADSLHLYLNMACLLREGTWLERRVGGRWLLYLLCVFSLLSGVVYLLLQAVLAQLLTQNECAVGFSGVLFGLSVLKNHYDPDGVTILWVAPVRNRYVVWAELLLALIINSNSSLIGHLAGILVGLLYAKGPLETIMKMCVGLVPSFRI